jgi:hypothetical protein
MYRPYMYVHKQLVNEYHGGYLKKANKPVCPPAPMKKKLLVVVPKNSFRSIRAIEMLPRRLELSLELQVKAPSILPTVLPSSTHALLEQSLTKLLGYRSFHRKLLRYQRKKLPAIDEGPTELKANTDLTLEATTGLEATSGTTTTVAELSTSASAVPFDSLALSSACASIASDQHTIMYALSERAQNKLLRYQSFHKTILHYQKQMLPAIHEGPDLEATTDLKLEAATHLKLEAATGLEATSTTNTVAELSTSASAVPFDSLALSSACALILYVDNAKNDCSGVPSWQNRQLAKNESRCSHARLHLWIADHNTLKRHRRNNLGTRSLLPTDVGFCTHHYRSHSHVHRI